jgi:hypothetical protein
LTLLFSPRKLAPVPTSFRVVTVKTYRSAKQVLSQIQPLIRELRPSPHQPSALVRVAKLLHDGRNYDKVAISLEAGGQVVRSAVCGPDLETPGGPRRSELRLPIQILTQHLGTLSAESHAGFTGEDRVLLKESASLLARYLTTNGRYLMRKAREAVRERESGRKERHQPESDKGSEPQQIRRAAVGQKVPV